MRHPHLGLALTLTLTLLTGSLLAADRPIETLVVTGGHGYEVGPFEALLRGLDGVRATHQKHPEALRTLASKAASRFDVVLLYDMTQPIDDAQKAAYSALFRSGTGLVVLHHALANYQAWPEYERMVGGRYLMQKRTVDGVEQPASGYLHDVDIPVTVADREHYITRGLEDFTIHDETYARLAIDPAVRPLLRTKEPTSSPVLAWVKPYGKARVAAIQLGHDSKAWTNPAFRTILSRAIRWSARRTPEDAAMRPIFNGKDLTGWTAYGNARFAVEDGCLVGRQGPGGAAGDIFTDALYGDFELETHWKMDWPGNSGVWFRFENGRKAYQADILEYKSPVAWSGSLYCGGKMFIALQERPEFVRREGWNSFRIRAEGDHIVVHLNGHKVADVRDDSSPLGKIGLQVHAGDTFRDMAIRIADMRIRPLR